MKKKTKKGGSQKKNEKLFSRHKKKAKHGQRTVKQVLSKKRK